MTNPYSFKPVDRLDELYGRTALMREILDSQDNWALIGERRIGKTSVLRNFEAFATTFATTRAIGDGVGEYIVAYIDLQSLIGGDIAISFFRKLFSNLGLPTLKRRARSCRSLDELVALYEAFVGRIRRENGRRRVLICIDEFDTLLSAQNRDFVNFIRAMTKERPIQVVGAAFRNLKHISEGFEASPFFNVFRQKRLGCLAPAAARQTVTFAGAYERFTPALIDELYDATGGNPYLIKVLCYFLWSFAPDESTRLDAADLGRVYEDTNATQMLNSHCEYAWGYLTDLERYLLLNRKPYHKLREKGYQYGDETIGIFRWWLETNAYRLQLEFDEKDDDELEALKQQLEELGRGFSRIVHDVSKVHEISIIHNDGVLLRHHPDLDPAANDQSEVIASMFDAIRVFVKDSFGKHEGQLDGLQFGDKKVMVENGSYFYLLVIVARDLSEDFRVYLREVIAQIETEHRSAFEEWWGLITPEIDAACDDLIARVLD